MARGLFNIQDIIDDNPFTGAVAPDPRGVGTTIRETSGFEIPSDLLINTDIQREFFQDFMEIFRESQAEDDGRLERQTQAAEWLRVLGEYATGQAELSELEAVDVSDLMEIEGFEDYYYGVVPRKDFGEETDTGETEEETKTLQDYIDEFGEDVVNTAQGIYDDVGGFIEGAKDDPLGTLVSILDVVVDAGIPEKCQDLKDCKTANPDKGTYCWKDCVNFSILTGIPGLPSLPGMQDVGTYRDFEDAVKEIGTTIGDVIEGNANCGENNDQDCTVSQVLTDAGTWVMKKIEGVFKDIDDASIDDAYDWIKGIFGAAVGGFVFSQVKEEIEDLFFPVGPSDDPLINCADYGREGGQVADVNDCGNCFEKGVEPGEDGRCRRVIQDDFEDDDDEVDLFGVEATCKRERKEYNEILDECGDCIQEGYAPGADGVCAPVGDDGGTDDEIFDLPCPEGHKRFNGECDLPCPTNPSIAASDPRCGGGGDDGGGTTTETPTFTVVCGQKEPYAPTGNALAYNLAYREYEAEYNAQCLSGGGGDTNGNGGEEQCSGGKVRVNGECECPAGTTEINGECVSVSGGDDTTSTGGGTTFNCISQNRQTNEDGSCGACLPGYSPDPNNFDQCVKDDTVVGGEPPGPTTETPPPSTSSGGGGGGGGGAGGMFTGTVSGISYAPQALPGIQTPAPVNAMASLEGLIGRMLTGNIS